DAATPDLHGERALPLRDQRDVALMRIAARPGHEDAGTAIKARAPAVEMADLDDRLGGRDHFDAFPPRSQAKRLHMRELLRRWHSASPKVASVGNAQINARMPAGRLLLHDLDAHAWH